jgi:hypothetical protein
MVGHPNHRDAVRSPVGPVVGGRAGGVWGVLLDPDLSTVTASTSKVVDAVDAVVLEFFATAPGYGRGRGGGLELPNPQRALHQA